MARWVCLQRGEVVCLLKCLDCGWKWKSKARYAGRLPDWAERARSGMTDEMILTRLLNGNLRIDPVTSVVESNLKGRWQVLQQVENQHESGYRCVSVCWEGQKKKITVHRLQWLAYSGKVVPEGYDVHHKRSPPRPQMKPNALENLELKDSLENQSIGKPPGWDEGLPF